MDLFINVTVFFILFPFGLILFFKPVSFLKLVNSSIETEEELKKKLKYARYGAVILLTYIVLKTISLIIN